MKGVVYILQFKNSGNYYIGSTNNLKRRIEQHLIGHTSTTSKLGEFELVFYQEFDSLIDARRVEKKIKSWKRHDFIEKIVKDGEIKSVS